jgi:hypothetical protein
MRAGENIQKFWKINWVQNKAPHVKRPQKNCKKRKEREF